MPNKKRKSRNVGHDQMVDEQGPSQGRLHTLAPKMVWSSQVSKGPIFVPARLRQPLTGRQKLVIKNTTSLRTPGTAGLQTPNVVRSPAMQLSRQALRVAALRLGKRQMPLDSNNLRRTVRRVTPSGVQGKISSGLKIVGLPGGLRGVPVVYKVPSSNLPPSADRPEKDHKEGIRQAPEKEVACSTSGRPITVLSTKLKSYNLPSGMKGVRVRLPQSFPSEKLPIENREESQNQDLPDVASMQASSHESEQISDQSVSCEKGNEKEGIRQAPEKKIGDFTSRRPVTVVASKLKSYNLPSGMKGVRVRLPQSFSSQKLPLENHEKSQTKDQHDVVSMQASSHESVQISDQSVSCEKGNDKEGIRQAPEKKVGDFTSRRPITVAASKLKTYNLRKGLKGVRVRLPQSCSEKLPLEKREKSRTQDQPDDAPSQTPSHESERISDHSVSCEEGNEKKGILKVPVKKVGNFTASRPIVISSTKLKSSNLPSGMKRVRIRLPQSCSSENLPLEKREKSQIKDQSNVVSTQASSHESEQISDQSVNREKDNDKEGIRQASEKKIGDFTSRRPITVLASKLKSYNLPSGMKGVRVRLPQSFSSQKLPLEKLKDGHQSDRLIDLDDDNDCMPLTAPASFEDMKRREYEAGKFENSSKDGGTRECYLRKWNESFNQRCARDESISDRTTKPADAAPSKGCKPTECSNLSTITYNPPDEEIASLLWRLSLGKKVTLEELDKVIRFLVKLKYVHVHCKEDSKVSKSLELNTKTGRLAKPPPQTIFEPPDSPPELPEPESFDDEPPLIQSKPVRNSAPTKRRALSPKKVVPVKKAKTAATEKDRPTFPTAETISEPPDCPPESSEPGPSEPEPATSIQINRPPSSKTPSSEPATTKNNCPTSPTHGDNETISDPPETSKPSKLSEPGSSKSKPAAKIQTKRKPPSKRCLSLRSHANNKNRPTSPTAKTISEPPEHPPETSEPPKLSGPGLGPIKFKTVAKIQIVHSYCAKRRPSEKMPVRKKSLRVLTQFGDLGDRVPFIGKSSTTSPQKNPASALPQEDNQKSSENPVSLVRGKCGDNNSNLDNSTRTCIPVLFTCEQCGLRMRTPRDIWVRHMVSCKGILVERPRDATNDNSCDPPEKEEPEKRKCPQCDEVLPCDKDFEMHMAVSHGFHWCYWFDKKDFDEWFSAEGFHMTMRQVRQRRKESNKTMYRCVYVQCPSRITVSRRREGLYVTYNVLHNHASGRVSKCYPKRPKLLSIDIQCPPRLIKQSSSVDEEQIERTCHVCDKVLICVKDYEMHMAVAHKYMWRFHFDTEEEFQKWFQTEGLDDTMLPGRTRNSDRSSYRCVKSLRSRLFGKNEPCQCRLSVTRKDGKVSVNFFVLHNHSERAVRGSITSQCRAMIAKMISDDCDDLTILKTIKRTYPSTSVNNYLVTLDSIKAYRKWVERRNSKTRRCRRALSNSSRHYPSRRAVDASPQNFDASRARSSDCEGGESSTQGDDDDDASVAIVSSPKKEEHDSSDTDDSLYF